MRLLLVGLVFVLTLALLLAAAISLSLVSSGPHASALPAWLDAVLCTAIWFAVVALPFWIALRVRKHLGRAPPPPSTQTGP